MVKRIVKIFYVLGMIFWIGMMLGAFLKHLVYNEYLNLFEIGKLEISEYEMKLDSVKSYKVNLDYSYTVEGKIYNKKMAIARRTYDKNFQLTDRGMLEVRYVKLYPEMSYLTSLPLEKKEGKTGIMISFFFLLFISLIYFLAKKRWSS